MRREHRTDKKEAAMAVSDVELRQWGREAQAGQRYADPELKKLHSRILRLTGTAGRLRENNRCLNDVRNAAIACLKDSSNCGQLKVLLKNDVPYPDEW